MVMEKKGFSVVPRHAYPLSIIFAAIILLCVITLACFQYYHRLENTVKNESADYLQEISKQIVANAGSAIETNFSILGTVATVLKNAEVSTFEQMSAITLDQQQHWHFEHLLLVDEAGVAYDYHGDTALLRSDAYLQEAIVNRHRAISTSQMMGGTECIVFAIPVDGLSVAGKEMSALVGTFELSTFDQMLSITAFDGAGYGHIIRRDGTVVIRSSSPNAPKTGYNILNSIESAHFSGPVQVETVLKDIENGVSGQAELTLDGVPLCMAYTSLGPQEWCLLTFVPVAVATEKSSHFLSSTLLIGVLISLVFGCLLAVLVYTTYRHKRALEQLAFVDPVTGGNTIQRFYTKGAFLLSAPNAPRYALTYTNIGKFKVLNDQLGRAACDMILKTTSMSILQDLDSDECSGRLFADNFCVLLKYTDEENLAYRLGTWTKNYTHILEQSGNAWLPLTVEIGVYVIDDPALPLPDMIDRAKLALRETPRAPDAQVHYQIYDEQVRQRIFREKHLEDMMAPALERQEFLVYLQPKYCTSDERIGGAEALVRWQSAAEGMIYPDEFISLFEKNGFIVQLDLWVFEQVCRTLRLWLDRGLTPMRISVNCSRVHLKMPGFLDQYCLIADRYAVPHRLLEIEVTENVVFEDVHYLTQIIAGIHTAGFSCSMDDFGSGYSSLNLIQDIPVDVLKLDKIFFRSNAHGLGRTESVVGSIIAMARALSMETVAEGVEERHQVDMLRRLGCDYIQGYYFARPMSIPDFEVLAFGALHTEEL